MVFVLCAHFEKFFVLGEVFECLNACDLKFFLFPCWYSLLHRWHNLFSEKNDKKDGFTTSFAVTALRTQELCVAWFQRQRKQPRIDISLN